MLFGRIDTKRYSIRVLVMHEAFQVVLTVHPTPAALPSCFASPCTNAAAPLRTARVLPPAFPSPHSAYAASGPPASHAALTSPFSRRTHSTPLFGVSLAAFQVQRNSHTTTYILSERLVLPDRTITVDILTPRVPTL